MSWQDERGHVSQSTTRLRTLAAVLGCASLGLMLGGALGPGLVLLGLALVLTAAS